jgi:hypothetical protein
MEDFMKGVISVICFIFFVSVFGGQARADEGQVTFRIQNNAPYTVNVKLFSDTRKNWQWPTSSTHWTLDDGKLHELTVSCRVGEKVCYGGWYANEKTYWGVGFEGRQSCTDCCLTCGTVGENVNHSYDLND